MTENIEWRVSDEPVAYEEALGFMEERVRAIREEGTRDCVWLLEHPPLYTAGTSAKAEDLLETRFPVHDAGRGGQYTYHGPGQRVGYVMMDLQQRAGKVNDLRAYVHDLEEWVIRALGILDVEAERRRGAAGVWVGNDKIAAIGVRVRRWVAFHGVAVNRAPDLGHYAGIVPCGIRDGGVTSLKKLGLDVAPAALDDALKAAFEEVF